jgi:hypothetical protein
MKAQEFRVQELKIRRTWKSEIQQSKAVKLETGN